MRTHAKRNEVSCQFEQADFCLLNHKVNDVGNHFICSGLMTIYACVIAPELAKLQLAK